MQTCEHVIASHAVQYVDNNLKVSKNGKS